MRRSLPDGAKEAIERASRNPARGKLYWWLYDSYASIQRNKAAGRPIAWQTMLAEVQALGLTNADGKPIASEAALRKTFSRVRHDKQAATEQRRPKQRAAWHKPANAPPPVAVPATPYQVPAWAPAMSKATPPSSGDAADDELTRQLKQRSNWR